MRVDRTCPRTDPDRTDGEPVPIRNMHDVFSNWYRRAILYYLQDHDDPVSVTAVARQLVAWQRESAEGSGADAAAVERTRPRILEVHIAAMEEFGILGYDPVADTVWIHDDATISVVPPWEDRATWSGPGPVDRPDPAAED